MKLFLFFACVSSLLMGVLCDVVPLPSYRIAPSSTSLSGFSSGAFMAVQYQVAFSSSLIGAAIFAGGPFDCAEGSMSSAEIVCMYAVSPPVPSTYISITDELDSLQAIDKIENLKSHKVYMFSGIFDSTVKQTVMDSLQQYYENYLPSSNIQYVNSMGAAHTFPTDNPLMANACSTSSSPFISNCGYDGAGAALQQIYGELSPRSNSSLTGTLINFDQTQFTSSVSDLSLDTSGYAYIPAACSQGQECKLHLVLHGCEQYASEFGIGTVFVTESGYLQWADTNNIIVIFPQTVSSMLSNPNGCWDWWGYAGDSNTYFTKDGPQMQFINNILSHVSGNTTNTKPAQEPITIASQ